MWIWISIGIIIYVSNVVGIILAVSKNSSRYFIALPIVPWLICVLPLLHADLPLYLKLMMAILVTSIEAFIDCGLSRMTRNTCLRRLPLHAAVLDNDVQRVQLLLSHGADVNARALDWSALEIAISKGHSDLVDLLISNGASTKADPGTPFRHDALGFAAYEGNLQIVQQLVERGASVNDAEGIKSSALIAAIRFRHLDTAEFLLKCGAACGANTAIENSPLIIAVEQGSLDAVKLLLQYGADANVRNLNGKTAMELNSRSHSKNKEAIERALTQAMHS